jgi:hypothetical protein
MGALQVLSMDKNTFERERILSTYMREIGSELRLIDVVNLVVYIKQENHANIDDLISSSAELFFKPGVLNYSSAADVNLTWGGSPSVAFDLEFHHQGVTVFFSLLLGATQAGVDIRHIIFEGPEMGPEENNLRLISALEDARLKRS